MSRRNIASRLPHEQAAGCSRAVVIGNNVFVSLSNGEIDETGNIPEGVSEQTEQALRNIGRTLLECGSSMLDVARICVYLTDEDNLAVINEVLMSHFGEIGPANSTLITRFSDPRELVKIEVIAVKGEQ